MIDEKWADIPGWEGWYQASTEGRVRSVARTIVKLDGQRATWAGKVLRGNAGPNGYPLVALTRPGEKKRHEYVHRLVALTFLGPCPDRFEVCHGDGSRDNNRLTNLRYDTRRANAMDRHAHGTFAPRRGSDNPNAKLVGLESVIAALAGSMSRRAIGRHFGVNHNTVSRILRDAHSTDQRQQQVR